MKVIIDSSQNFGRLFVLCQTPRPLIIVFLTKRILKNVFSRHDEVILSEKDKEVPFTGDTARPKSGMYQIEKGAKYEFLSILHFIHYGFYVLLRILNHSAKFGYLGTIILWENSTGPIWSSKTHYLHRFALKLSGPQEFATRFTHFIQWTHIL